LAWSVKEKKTRKKGHKKRVGCV